MPNELLLELSGGLSQLDRITREVERFAGEQGWPDGVSGKIILVLEELEMNIINHAYPAGVEPRCSMLLQAEADKLTITVKDQGSAFNPLDDAAQPDLDASLTERRVGGLGIHLVKSLVDELQYHREDGSNVLRLVMGLPNEG